MLLIRPLTMLLIAGLCLSTGLVAAAEDRGSQVVPPSGAPSDPDPFPTFVADACGWPDMRALLHFETDRVEVTHLQSLEMLDHLIAELAREPGFLLLEGHVDADEAARAPGAGLDRRRAEWIQDEAIRRGVPAGRIWIKARGATLPQVVVPPGTAAPENRRVEVRIPYRGLSCYAQQQRLRLEWFGRNCVGGVAARPESECRAALRRMLP